MGAEARRTSRKPVQVGRWSPQALRAKQISTRLSGNGPTRTGHLHWQHVRATEVSGQDPVLRGRIAVDRGGGIVEFPTPQQFLRLAQQEKVPRDEVYTAFGHLLPRPQRRTSRHRRTKSVRTSRRPLFSLRPFFSLRPNAKKHIRRDDVFVPTKRSGEEVTLAARTVLIPEAEVGRFGSDHGVYMDMGGRVRIEPYANAMRLAQPWLTKHEFRKAFGHLRGKGVVGKTPVRRKIPEHYGPRSMRLGHRKVPGEGPVEPGVVKGQLILFHKPSGSIMWQAYDDEATYPDKPIWIWFGASKGHFDFAEAMQGARVGKGTGERRKSVGALDIGIPPMAMLAAFDYLLPPEVRRQAYETFARTED